MATDLRLTIKTLLFNKAIPNHVIPVPTAGYKIYSCIDCGDKFMFQSNYEYHLNRMSVKISFMCRQCGQMKIFQNRCALLSHIRSHAFKTTTIHVSELKVEPLPLSCFNLPAIQSDEPVTSTICPECNIVLSSNGSPQKDREKHFMLYTNEIYKCPVCLFTMPTICGLKAHMRLHIRNPPYCCPECGMSMPEQNIEYPYNHNCEGFKMMRVTCRIKCQSLKCSVFHPNDQTKKDHIKTHHFKKVFKCPECRVACFSFNTITDHFKIHQGPLTPIVYYRCELCPRRLVFQGLLEDHLKKHPFLTVYPCWTCGRVFSTILSLLEHCLKHLGIGSPITKVIQQYLGENNSKQNKPLPMSFKANMGRIQKRKSSGCCVHKNSKLKNGLSCNCTNSPIIIIEDETIHEVIDDVSQIVCHLCKLHMPINWTDIKDHFATYHKTIKCLDLKLVIPKINIKEYFKHKSKNAHEHVKTDTLQIKCKSARGRPRKNKHQIHEIPSPCPKVTLTEDINGFACNICKEKCEDKQSLEKHIVSHRDPCMAYQCLECGQSFIAKPSFSTHLVVSHQITNPDEYIKNKECYNETALQSQHQLEPICVKPIGENQCSICRDQFDCAEDLKKHFRVHGMAFLLKSSLNKSTDAI